jgi:hypothetical protein
VAAKPAVAKPAVAKPALHKHVAAAKASQRKHAGSRTHARPALRHAGFTG